MEGKSLRSVYLNDDLEARLVELASQQHSSVSRLVRIALDKYLRDVLDGSEMGPEDCAAKSG